MPTSLPQRKRKAPDPFVVFVLSLAVAFFVIEIVDPAPMDVQAQLIATP